MHFGYIVTYVLATLGTLYGWLNPFVGLLIYHGFATLRPTALWHWSFPPDPPQFAFYVGLSTLVGWALMSFGDWSGLRGLRVPLTGLAVYLLSGVVAWQLCEHRPDLAWEALAGQLKVALMLLVTLTVLREPRQVRALAWVLAATLAYLAWVFNSRYLAGWEWAWIERGGAGDPHTPAMLMAIGGALTFWLGLHDPRPWVKGPCLAAAALMAHVVYFSGSAGAAVALAVVVLGTAAFLIADVWRRRRWRVAATALAVVVVLAAGLSGSAQARSVLARPFADGALALHVETWQAGLRCLSEHPLGLGPANFRRVSDQYGLPVNSPVDNLFLHVAVNYGLLGAVGLGVFFVATLWQTLRLGLAPAAGGSGWPRVLARTLGVAVGGFLAGSLFVPAPLPDALYALMALALCTVAYARRAAAFAAETTAAPVAAPATDAAAAGG